MDHRAGAVLPRRAHDGEPDRARDFGDRRRAGYRAAGAGNLPAGGADGAGGSARLCRFGTIATKKLTITESTFAIVFWMNVIQLALGSGRRGASVS